MENTNRDFKAQIFRDENGKITRINIHCVSETIKHPDGRQDVVIHAPSLGLLNRAVNPINNKEE